MSYSPDTKYKGTTDKRTNGILLLPMVPASLGAEDKQTKE